MAEGTEETTASRSKKGFSFKTIVIVLILAMGGFMGFNYLRQSGLLPGGAASEVPEEKQKKRGEEIIYVFEGNFLVNLLDPDNPRYLKLVLGVGFSDRKVESEIKKKNVEIRDTIIMVASAQAYEELIKPEGKENLKKLILTRVNELLTTGQVEKVYFLDFVIQ